MATLDASDSDLNNKVFNIINYDLSSMYICLHCELHCPLSPKGCAKGNAIIQRKVLSPDFLESEDAKSLRVNSIMANLSLPLIRGQKKTKQ